jgi:hypothetical protein
MIGMDINQYNKKWNEEWKWVLYYDSWKISRETNYKDWKEEW